MKSPSRLEPRKGRVAQRAVPTRRRWSIARPNASKRKAPSIEVCLYTLLLFWPTGDAWGAGRKLGGQGGALPISSPVCHPFGRPRCARAWSGNGRCRRSRRRQVGGVGVGGAGTAARRGPGPAQALALLGPCSLGPASEVSQVPPPPRHSTRQCIARPYLVTPFQCFF